MNRPTRRAAVIAAVLLVVVAASGFATERILAIGSTTFDAVFESTVGLYPGSEVQVLGVPVGTVTAVEPEGSQVRVSMELDRGQQVAADTGAVIVAPTLVSDRYVQLTQPYVGGPALKSGASIRQTAVPVEIDDLYRSLDDIGRELGPDGANSDGALARLLTVAAENLDGNGADLNRMIGEFGDASATLADSDDDLFATVANLSELNDMLVAHDQSVASANRQLAEVSEYLADDRDDLALAVSSLGDALADLDDFIRDNRTHLKNSVDDLTGPTQVLVKQQDSLEEAVRTIPLALQNFLDAYDVKTNTVNGRGNLNELSLWARDGLSASTSDDAPPVLLPGLGEEDQ